MFGVALITFLAGNTIFYFVIGDHQVSKDAMYTVAILRVVLLDGLFLTMAVILAICIIIVSRLVKGGSKKHREWFRLTRLLFKL